MFGSLIVTTVTCTTTLSRAVNVEEEWKTMSLTNGGVISARSPCGGKCRPEGSMRLGRNFGNQSTVLVAIPFRESLSNAKVFPNGSVQVTGVHSLDEGRHVAEAVARSVSCHENRVEARETSIQMINAIVRYSEKIDRPSLYEYIRRNRQNVHARFDPSTGTDLKLKMCFPSDSETNGLPFDGVCYCASKDCASAPKKKRSCYRCSVTIHKSGSIVLSGKCNMAHMHASINLVKRLVSGALVSSQ